MSGMVSQTAFTMVEDLDISVDFEQNSLVSWPVSLAETATWYYIDGRHARNT